MKKNIKALLLAAMMLCTVLFTCACTSEPEPDPTYKVSVVDAVGNPYTSGVIVRILGTGEQAGEQIAMMPITETGSVEKQLPKGEYTVELMFTDSNAAYYYDKTDLTLSAEKTELQIVLAYAATENGQTLSVQGVECQAYPVSVGSTFVKLTAGGISYFLFTPTEAGTYQFSVTGAEATVGYYGAPHFVQASNAAEDLVDNGFTQSIKASMIGTSNTGTTVMVLGVETASATECILNIERIGDPKHTIEDEPWTVYEPTAELKAYTLPAGAKIGEFDITASSDAYHLVFNEADGYYHLNSADGPLVLVRLGKNANLKYIDPFQTILDHSGVNKYFFDEAGEFVKKESYSECLMEYFNYIDEASGTYPLTEDLKYIIQQRGEYSGWFDPAGDLYLFKDENNIPVPNVNNEISWLFMCCYIEG